MLFLFKTLVGLVLAFCLYLFGSGLYQGAVNLIHLQGSHKFTGKVVQYVISDDCSQDDICKYKQTVEYKDADNKIQRVTALNTSDRPVANKQVTVYEKDRKILVGNLPEIFSFSLMAVPLGGIFSWIIIWLIYKTIQGKNTRKQARERGLPVEATVTEVTKIADQKPYQWSIEATWKNPVNGKKITFLSELFEWDNVSGIVPGRSIRVMVDMSNPERVYWVDLSSVGINYGRT
jgi:hypothetical protein